MPLFSVQTRIVDEQGRPTPALVHALAGIVSSSSTGLEGRVTALETSNTSLLSRMNAAEGNIQTLQVTISAQAVTLLAHTASISANTAAIADLQLDDIWVTPWP